MDIIAMINVTEKEVRGEVEEVVGLVEKQEEKVDEKEGELVKEKPNELLAPM